MPQARCTTTWELDHTIPSFACLSLEAFQSTRGRHAHNELGMSHGLSGAIELPIHEVCTDFILQSVHIMTVKFVGLVQL